MQLLSGRELDSRLRGCGFEPHRRHCIVVLEQDNHPSLVLVQPRKTSPYLTEKLLMGRKESNKQNTGFTVQFWFCWVTYTLWKSYFSYKEFRMTSGRFLDNSVIWLFSSEKNNKTVKYKNSIWVSTWDFGTIKPVLSSHLKIDKTKVLMENGSLMKVKSIAECSPWSILQYFWPALSNNWYWKPILVFFLSGPLRQVLLYLSHCQATNAQMSLCKCADSSEP